MNKTTIKFIQEILSEKGLYSGNIDGIAGPITYNALDTIDDLPAEWKPERKLCGFVQLLAREHQIDAGPLDGLWGPQTQYGFDSLFNMLKKRKKPLIIRPEEIAQINPHGWPSQADEQNLIDFFGKVGENQKRMQLPYPHKLSWDTSTTVNRIMCHEKIHDSLQKVLTNILEFYGIQKIQRLRLDLWGGGFNVRPMRGGTRHSMHSWGIAMDYDPNRNRLQWGRDKAAFARPEYDAWWSFWEEEGWISLGRTRNFDWMHIQAAKI